MYLLDTNTCIYYLNIKNIRIVELIQKNITQVSLCTIVKAELWYGALHSRFPDKNCELLNRFFEYFPSLTFDDHCVAYYGKLRQHLTQTGKLIGPNDLLIAAIALANNKILVTSNSGEFSRVTDLQLENWAD